MYTRVVGATVRQAIGGTFAFAPLTLVISIASIKGLAGRPAGWQRTGKFRQVSAGGLSVLAHVRAEMSIGVGCLVAGAALARLASCTGITMMMAVTLAATSVTFLPPASLRSWLTKRRYPRCELTRCLVLPQFRRTDNRRRWTHKGE